MSRIGKAPINVPAGVEINFAEDNTVTVKGKLGTLTQKFQPSMKFEQDGAVVKVICESDGKFEQSLHGLTRTLLNNMVVGVTEGFSKTLEIQGVGYRASKAGKTLTLALGYSHPVIFEDSDAVKFEVPEGKTDTIIVKGIDKQAVGQAAAEVRAKRPPEPYLGKGIRYQGEFVRRKAGKAGK